MKRRLIAISSVCLLVTVAGAAALHVTGVASVVGRTHGTNSTNADREPSAEIRSASALSRSGWEPGVAYTHALDLGIGIVFGTPEDGVADSQRPMRLHLTGKLETLVSEVLGKDVRVRLRLVDAKLEAGERPVSAELARALATPFFADYDERGRALRLHVPPKLDPTVRGILRELVATTQLTAPERATARWKAVEADTTGNYEASYSTVAPNKIVRQKSGYVRVPSRGRAGASPATPDVVAYGAEFQLDDWGRVSELKCTSRVKATAGESSTLFEARSELTLKTLSRSRVTTGFPASIAGLAAASITSDANDAETTNHDRELVANTDVKGILEGRTTARDGKAADSETRLAALFRLDPRAIPQALALLDDGNARTIVSGLVGAGTEPGQDALREVLADERRSPAQRLAAVDGAFHLETPTAETSTALEELAREGEGELKGTATLALGATAARMAEEDPTEAQAVVKRMASDYASAPSNDERRRIASGLGNTRSADALPTLAQAMASSDPAVRAAAAAALRFVPDARADALLSKALTSDPDANVRQSALLAAGYRAYDPLGKALEAVAKDPDVNLRSTLVATLQQMAQRDSQAFVLLDWLATHDDSTEVRSRAQAALGQTS
jgi:HEAT repeat protein